MNKLYTFYLRYVTVANAFVFIIDNKYSKSTIVGLTFPTYIHHYYFHEIDKFPQNFLSMSKFIIF